MSGHRHKRAGGLIDRTQSLTFTFDGQTYEGLAGDTIASALMANGVKVVGRSFKLHRPRGLFGAWSEDASSIMDVRLGRAFRSNCQATTTALEAGMAARAVNAFPSARFDLKAGLDWFAPFFSAGFYYKTFTWPDWHWFEPAIRQAAGLGRVEVSDIGEEASIRQHRTVDVLVIGGGPAGLLAATAAAETGQDVLLVEDHPELGGSLHDLGADRGAGWIETQVAKLKAAGGEVLTNTTAFGLYDHQTASLIERRGFTRPARLWRLRAKRIILATGAIDRPLVCAGNDLPGVMSLKAAKAFAGRYGVLPGERLALASNQPDLETAAEHFGALGAEISIFDPTQAPLLFEGRRTLSRVYQSGSSAAIDAALVSSGQTPLLHLWSHAGGTLVWDEQRLALMADAGPDHLSVVGAAAGFTDDWAAHDEQATAVGRGETVAPAVVAKPLRSVTLDETEPRRQWIDLQNDVTLKDIRQSAQEAMTSVEHLKRFTTLGMATDQGKTANVNGLLAMAQITGRSVAETGTTRFRPPYTPVPMEIYRGTNRRQDLRPLKRLRLEAEHRKLGAALGEYGGWLRPAWYGASIDVVQDEARRARLTGGLFDASPLGKIEVAGPDAAAFLDFIYYNRISTLKPGAVRYGFMLTESGIVYDDGVVLRLDEQRFLVSCSSSHVAGVVGLLEAWRQDGNDPRRIFIHDQTPVWSTLTVTGPCARDVVTRMGLDCDLTAEALPHMRFAEAQFGGDPIRVARVSFTGDLSYELSVPNREVKALWQALSDIGARFDVTPIGLETVSLLRAEKGYLIVGKDTDGETMPHDLGFNGPLKNKVSAYVGDRGLKTDYAMAKDRLSLVGLQVEGSTPLPTGAHVLSGAAEGNKSDGYVTSSYFSPTLDRPIALALVRGGGGRLGERIGVYHLGAERSATIVKACQFDPDGERLHA